jgi:CDP-diacylglycerol--glycerol-3-phosphate 3-phosphatidyltransferase
VWLRFDVDFAIRVQTSRLYSQRATTVHRVWTVSNLISFSRILIVLPAAYCLLAHFPGNRLWAVIFILLASSTDFFDGYLARKLHQVSDLGKIIDPLADKIGIGIIAVCLLITGDIPLWYLVIVLTRDALIFLGGVYIKRQKGIVPQANMAGKIAVNVVALALLLSVVREQSVELLRWGMVWLSIAFMALSLVIYTKRLFIGRTMEVRN